MLLSTVDLFAAGATGQEQIQLQIDGQTVRTFNNVAGNYNTGQFQQLTWTTAANIDPDQIRVVFSNDGNTAGGADKNLRLDRIRVDGTTIQAEDSSVFSVGHWIDGQGCSEGNLQAETLECGGYFQFSNTASGSNIVVAAAGATGQEQIQLEIDGNVVRTWNNVGGNYNSGSFVNLSYTADGNVDFNDVRVIFSNDGNTAGGADKNVRIDAVTIDGVTRQTESAFVSGHWVDGQGCSSGFLGAETLECGGFVDFGATAGTTVTIAAAGRTGEEQLQLVINGQAVQTFSNIGGDLENRSFVNYTYQADGPVSINDVRVEFLNNGVASGGGDRDLAVDFVAIAGVQYQAESSDVFSEGHWVNGQGCVAGFVQAEVLNCNGYFDFSNVGQAGRLSLATNLINVSEDGGSAQITIIREQGSSGQVSVEYRTQSGTATSGLDFTSQIGTLTFADGQTSRTITIPITNDNENEGTETFAFTIDNPQGGVTLAAPRTAQIAIADDDAPTGDTLAAHWKFDETSFGTAADSTANSLNGTYVNYVAGQLGPVDERPLLDAPNTKALNFDGINDYVRVDGTASDLSSTTFTQTFWIRPEFLGNETRGLFSGTTAGFPRVAIQAARRVSFTIGTTTLTTNDILSPNEWNFVATSYDGQTMRIYVDGQEVASQAASGLGASTTNQFDIGRIGGSYYRGQIDDFKFHTASLSASAIADEFSSQTNVTEEVITNLPGAVAIKFVESTGQMFIGDFGGLIYIYENGQILDEPFINISGQVNLIRGMLDIAIHPDFINNPYVYMAFVYDPPETANFTGLAGPNGRGNRASRLIRVTADASNGYRTAVAGSEVVLLGTNSTWDNYNGFVDSTVDFDEPPAGILSDGSNLRDFLAADSETHTIDGLEFGPDGALYVSNGDGASYNQQDPRAARVLDIDNLSGKILRIDPITGQGLSDNPFYNGDANANRSKVYQYGLRNPFRFTIDSNTGQVYVGDVGWTNWEEINAGGAGANYGWPYFEGADETGPLTTTLYEDLPDAIAYYNSAAGQNTTGALVNLSHSADSIDAVILGDIYDGGVYGSEYTGDLFFGFLGSGLIRHISFDDGGNVVSIDSFFDSDGFIVDMTVGLDGHLYYVDQANGNIGRWIVS